MAIRLRNDIVLEKVSGIYILVAKRSAWDSCPFAIQAGPLTAHFWRGLQSGIDEDTIIESACQELKIPREKVIRFYGKFMETAKKYNYLIQGDSDQ